MKADWLTNGVYRIITAPLVAENEGYLHLEDVPDILKKRKSEDPYYPPDKHPFIIGMMKKFELCYALGDDQILIPDLLPRQEPEALAFDATNALRYYIQYEFLPRSVLPRFMVQRHRDIRQQWRTGVLLEDSDFETKALVKADHEDRQISIWVNGAQPQRYFATLRKTLRDLHSDFKKLPAVEWVPLPDDPEHAIEYERLVGLEQMGEREYVDGITKKRYPVAQLLDGIERPEERLPEPMARMLEKGGLHLHFEQNQHVDVRQANVQKQLSIQQTTITVEVKNESVRELSSTLATLKEDLLDEIEDGQDRKKLGKELDRVEQALAQLGEAKSQEKAKTSQAMKRLSKFIEKLGDTGTRMGQAIQAVENGVGYAQDLAKYYNGIAQWVGLPQVPRPLLKQPAEAD